ncbi:MAG: hypothetical protein EZS28_023545 [Streblomastix strix]|uniref:Uncharacterized protein n=1 Tax=Streblomastix strix TaxID=222440 RepID=A0A5J4VEB3_9EUKA|nr:MAG: hypothetical protein EZS28_023545 [Streblomastix strix]
MMFTIGHDIKATVTYNPNDKTITVENVRNPIFRLICCKSKELAQTYAINRISNISNIKGCCFYKFSVVSLGQSIVQTDDFFGQSELSPIIEVVKPTIDAARLLEAQQRAAAIAPPPQQIIIVVQNAEEYLRANPNAQVQIVQQDFSMNASTNASVSTSTSTSTNASTSTSTNAPINNSTDASTYDDQYKQIAAKPKCSHWMGKPPKSNYIGKCWLCKKGCAVLSVLRMKDEAATEENVMKYVTPQGLLNWTQAGLVKNTEIKEECVARVTERPSHYVNVVGYDPKTKEYDVFDPNGGHYRKMKANKFQYCFYQPTAVDFLEEGKQQAVNLKQAIDQITIGPQQQSPPNEQDQYLLPKSLRPIHNEQGAFERWLWNKQDASERLLWNEQNRFISQQLKQNQQYVDKNQLLNEQLLPQFLKSSDSDTIGTSPFGKPVITIPKQKEKNNENNQTEEEKEEIQSESQSENEIQDQNQDKEQDLKEKDEQEPIKKENEKEKDQDKQTQQDPTFHINIRLQQVEAGQDDAYRNMIFQSGDPNLIELYEEDQKAKSKIKKAAKALGIGVGIGYGRFF